MSTNTDTCNMCELKEASKQAYREALEATRDSLALYKQYSKALEESIEIQKAVVDSKNSTIKLLETRLELLEAQLS